MTYLEMYMAQKPELTDEDLVLHMLSSCPYELNGRLKACPPDLFESDKRNIQRCIDCWNRGIPGIEPTNKTENNEREETKMEEKKTTIHAVSAGMRKTEAQLLEEIAALQKEIKELEKYKQYEDAANETYAVMESFMKAGFTREEAFVMTGKIVEQGLKMAQR